MSKGGELRGNIGDVFCYVIDWDLITENTKQTKADLL